MVIGSVDAGYRATDLMTLVSIAARNDLDVFLYVKDYWTACLPVRRITTLCGPMSGSIHIPRPFGYVASRSVAPALTRRWSDAPDAGLSLAVEPAEHSSILAPAGMVVLGAHTQNTGFYNEEHPPG